MHRTNRVPRAPFGGLLLLSLFFGGLPAYGQAVGEAPPPKPAPAVGANAVVVPIGGIQRLMMTTKRPIRTITNENDRIASITALREEPNVILIRGQAAGITRLTLTDVDGKTETFEIAVQLDIEMLRTLIQRSVPTANVVPIPGAGNTIILTGTVAHAEDVDVIMRIAQSVVGTPGAAQAGGGAGPAPGGPTGVINALRVGGVQQVQLDVCIARVNRSKVRRMSFDWVDRGLHHDLFSTVGGGFNITGLATGATGIPSLTTTVGNPNGAPVNIFFSIFNDQQQFFGFLQALKDESLAKLLTKPSLVTLSGRPASFVDGGDQAVPDVSGIGGTAGVRFEPFGTTVNFLPIVLGNGKIYLEVEPSVSALDTASGTPIPGTGGIVPGRLVQRVRTSVMMEDGQTFVIAGLIQHSVQANSRKIPVLGDLPLIGAAFSNKRHDEIEEELMVLVTPHLVDPLDCSQAPKILPGQETRSPDDFELFLEGILEAPRGPRQVLQENGQGWYYQAAYKNDPTAKVYPCAGGEGGRCGFRCGGGCNGAACQGGSLMPSAVSGAAQEMPSATAPVANDAGAAPPPTTTEAAAPAATAPVGENPAATLPPTLPGPIAPGGPK